MQTVTIVDIKLNFLRVNPWKPTGPDEVPSRGLRTRTDQLAGVFMDDLNISLFQSDVAICFVVYCHLGVKEKQASVP